MRKLSKCALCNNDVKLELSHIVPKMAIRHLKKISAGAIRNAENPNAVVQDGEKHYMLCGECEDLFSKYETYFANTVFHPYLSYEKNSFSYDEKLFFFITSVSWRSTYLDILDYVEKGTCDVELLNCLIENEQLMRAFLLGKRNDIGDIEHHIFFFDEIREISGKSKEEIAELRPHVSLHRSITSYTFSYNYVSTCGNFTNMMGIALISLYKKAPSEKWENTIIINGSDTLIAGNQIVQSVVGNDFFEVMETAKLAAEKINDVQKEKIATRLNAVGEKIKDYKVFKDWKSDVDIETDEQGE